MSRVIGQRFDLIQAGGGNTSVKLSKEQMLIKASGHLLSDMGLEKGYVEVNNERIKDIMKDVKIINEEDKKKREQIAGTLLKEAVVNADISARPSIETFLHSLLYKYTIHTHPIAVNMIACKKDWSDRLKKLFPKAMFVKYITPGIDLAIELKEECKIYESQNGVLPQIIFLQNHGIIISCDDYEQVIELHESVIIDLEQMLKINFNDYKLVNKISELQPFAKRNLLAYYSEDNYINELLKTRKELFKYGPTCPDTFIYCGYMPQFLETISTTEEIDAFIEEYQEYPKVLIYEGKVYFIAVSLKKAKEAEEVFKFHLKVLEQGIENIEFLKRDELDYLCNWEAEKFRQNV